MEPTREGSDADPETVVSGAEPASSLAGHGPLHVGRFTILAELGRGGMGIVYAAYDPDLDRKVAIKLLRVHTHEAEQASEGRARLLREAQAMARLSHPNVATVHEVGTVGQQVFLAMEFIKGRTLQAWVAELGRPAGWQAIVGMFVQAGEGLAAAHRAGLVHRDFKPDNVLVDDEGRARVLDFGLARAERSTLLEPTSGERSPGDRELEANLTRVGQVMGTPAYMAPEQLMGQPLDGRSDQFSFCVALYEALCGERPFTAATFVALRQRVLSGEPPVPPDHVAAPAWLLRVVLRGLRLHPADRYDTMQELLDALARDPGRRRRRTIVGLAAGLLVAGGVIGSLAYVEHELDRARVTSDPCADAAAALRGIWDADRKRAIRAAFAETKLGYAESTWERISPRLDEYAARWAAASVAVCRATAIDHAQSDELRLVRQSCLSRRLSELRAHTAIFVRADPRVVEGAVAGIDQLLKDPDECRTVQTMHVEMPLPVDEAAAARVAELRQRLDDVMALITSGKRDEALAIAEEVAVEAERLAYLPFVAEAQLRLGITLEKQGRYDEAAKALGAALTAAEVGRHDAAAVDAWNEWLRAVGYRQGHHEVARATLPRLDAALRRLGTDALREAAAYKTRGTLAYAEGDFEAAVRWFRAGLEIVERELGPEHGQTAILCQNLGTALERVGRYDEAERVLARGLEIWSSNQGSQHPGLSAIHESLGDVARDRKDTKAAIHHYTLALELFEQSHDALHPELALRYRELGQAHEDARHPEEAIGWYRKALEAERARLRGPEPPFASSLALARELLDHHRESEAVGVLQEVLAHPEVAREAEVLAEARRLLASASAGAGRSGSHPREP